MYNDISLYNIIHLDKNNISYKAILPKQFCDKCALCCISAGR